MHLATFCFFLIIVGLAHACRHDTPPTLVDKVDKFVRDDPSSSQNQKIGQLVVDHYNKGCHDYYLQEFLQVLTVSVRRFIGATTYEMSLLVGRLNCPRDSELPHTVGIMPVCYEADKSERKIVSATIITIPGRYGYQIELH